VSPLSKLSLVQLVSVALGVVLLPPVVALFVAAVAVEDLATSGSTTVRDAVHTVELTHGLVEQVTALERIARQRQILGDGDLKTRHLERREELVSVIGELDGLELPASLHERLDALQQQEHDLHAVLATAEPTSASYDAAVNELGALGDTALVLQRGAYEALRADARDLQSRAGRMQDRLMLLGWLAVPLAVGFVFTVLFGVVRPLRSLGAAIRRLGAGTLDEPIAVRGPGDLQQLGQRLEWLRVELLAAEDDRVRLFHHVSHELKTPLACIREGTQLLSDGVMGELSPGQHEITDILASNTERLHQQIEDLLRISGMRTRGPELEVVDVDIAEVVDQVADHWRVAARSRGVDILVDAASVWLRGDPVKLRTAIGNLVSNALKHGPAGRPVRLRAHSHAERVVVEVEDEGPGVPQAEREEVFTAFRQGLTAWSSAAKGTGLGLTIAREYFRAHGGDVTIETGTIGARVVAWCPQGTPGAVRPPVDSAAAGGSP